MQFVITKQIAVEAETVEEAVTPEKIEQGNTISLSVNPRPQPPAPRPGIAPNIVRPQ